MSILYQKQRAMRAMRQAAIQRGLISVIDIGSTQITCLVLAFDGPEEFSEADGLGRMAGQSKFRVIGAATTRARGVRFGEIEAMGEAERAIRTVVQQAQRDANVRVDHVIACFSGAMPRSYGLDGSVDLDGEMVTEADIGQVLSNCEVPDFGPAREVLHAHPVNFAIDHRSGLSDPRGQIGNTLSADLHVLTVNASAIENLLYCMKRCDLELAGVASSAYVSGLSSLVEDEQELGAACIDLGGGTSSLSIFLKKHMIYADSVRIGGDHITQDIAMGLQVSPSVAERIKTVHGGLVATGQDDRERIDLTELTGDYDRDLRYVSRADLIMIMRPRVEEILENLRYCLDAAGFEHLPGKQIVLTGGSCQIPGMTDLAARILGSQVRIASPLRVTGLRAQNSGPTCSAAIGMTLFAANPQDEWWDFDIPADPMHARSLRRAVQWFRANW